MVLEYWFVFRDNIDIEFILYSIHNMILNKSINLPDGRSRKTEAASTSPSATAPMIAAIMHTVNFIFAQLIIEQCFCL